MTDDEPLDAIDLKILTELQRDGRIRNNELAERVGISPPPCLRRLRSLRRRGYVRAIRATLDEKLLGLEVTSFVTIQLKSQARSSRAGVRGGDHGDAACPAVLAALGGCRLPAEMPGALTSRRCTGTCCSLRRCRRSTPSGACRCLVCPRTRRCPCRKRPTLARQISGDRLLGPANASRVRRAGTQNCRHRRSAGPSIPSARSPGRRCPCARNRRPRLPCSRSAG